MTGVAESDQGPAAPLLAGPCHLEDSRVHGLVGAERQRKGGRIFMPLTAEEGERTVQNTDEKWQAVLDGFTLAGVSEHSLL